MKPLYELLLGNIKTQWNKDLETLLQQTKTSIPKDVTLTLPITNHPFFFTVGFSLTGIGCVLFQINDKG